LVPIDSGVVWIMGSVIRLMFIDTHFIWHTHHIPDARSLEFWDGGWEFNEVKLRQLAASIKKS
jgi:hypothetical protein